MTSTRPSKEELDAWETLGNPGWNWEVFDRCIKKVGIVSLITSGEISGIHPLRAGCFKFPERNRPG